MNHLQCLPSLSRKAILHLLFFPAIAMVGCVSSDHDSHLGTTTQAANCHDIAPAAFLTATQSASSLPAHYSSRPLPLTDHRMLDGAAAYSAGDFGRAASIWERAAREYADAHYDGERCDALLDLGTAYESLGSYKESAESLNIALGLAERIGVLQRSSQSEDGVA